MRLQFSALPNVLVGDFSSLQGARAKDGIVMGILLGLIAVIVDYGLVGAKHWYGIPSLFLIAFSLVAFPILCGVFSVFFARKLFSGTGNYSKSIGFFGYVGVVNTAITILSAIVLIWATSIGLSKPFISAFGWYVDVIGVFWGLLVGMRAVSLVNNLSGWRSLVCFILSSVSFFIILLGLTFAALRLSRM